jgi:hypothetical protein
MHQPMALVRCRSRDGTHGLLQMRLLLLLQKLAACRDNASI